ncbi:MAG: hypothetical protein ACOCWQ_00045 [Nanoarchaeota archaeon]
MARKKEDKHSWTTIFAQVREGISTVSQALFSNVFSQVNQEADILLDKAEQRVMIIEDRILGRLKSAALMGVGALLIILAVLFFLIEDLGLWFYEAFGIMGIIVIVVGLIIRVRQLTQEKQQKGGE